MEVTGARDIPLLEPSVSNGGGCPVSPELKKGCFGTISFSWLDSLIRTGYRRSLQESDIYELLPVDSVTALHKEIHQQWSQELVKAVERQSLSMALARGFGRTFAAAGVFKFFYDTLQLAGPYILKALLRYIKECEEGECKLGEGLTLAALMLLSNLLQTAVLHQYFHRCFRTGMRLKAAAISLIYSKALRYSGRTQAGTNSERHSSTTGEIVNLMSVDAQRLQDTMPYLHVLWSGPYQIIIALTFLYFVVKWAFLAGLAVMFLQIPVVTFVTGRVKKRQKELMKMKDERIKVTNEVFTSLRLVKMYSWEESFRAKLDGLRDRELRQLRRYQLLSICSRSIWTVAPIFTGIATFSVYIALYGDLDASTAFTALALFNVLRFPLAMFPNMVTSSAEAKLAIERIQRFLGAGEVPHRQRQVLDLGQTSVLKITEASLRWPDDNSPMLEGVDLEVPVPREGQRPHLTVVAGGVGTGKSGLLQAVIGEIAPTSGTITMAGTMSYAPQAVWIRNATVKENITFGRDFDPVLYDQVLEACCLIPDLEVMQAGDQTEIGEKGINLSGGQKARVALARAIYAQADLLLLDDPLSAVDAHVAKKLLTTLRSRLLSRSSIVLCTHHPSALEVADQVVFLQGGAVKFSGSASDFHLNFRQSLDWQRSLSGDSAPQEEDPDTKENGSSKGTTTKAGGGNLVQREVEQQGSVPFHVYKKYIDHAGGTWLALSVGIGILIGTALQTSADAWLSHWADHFDSIPRGVGLGGYAGFSIAAFAGVFCSNGLFMITALKAARAFHHSLLRHMLTLPVAFYDATPLGRVLNRFSKDIYTIDEQLQSTLFMYFQTIARVAATLAVICIATPWFLLCIVPLILLYRYIQNYYIPSSRQIKRIESNLRSPVFSHFSETLDGLTSIRAFAAQSQFLEESLGKLQRNCRAYYLQMASNRWLAVRLETIGTMMVTIASLLAVLASSRGISSGLAGLSVSYAISVTQALNWVVRMASDLETNIVSVERVTEYLDQTPEAAPVTDQDRAGWPEKGEIEFQDVCLRYRPELPLVLQDVSFTIQAGEKIGIAGRTGAGKSSMMNCLLRLTELAGGRILIDGADISKLGLKGLRQSLAIIPQDPVMFVGNVRFNMDPVGASSDAQVWEALRRCHLEGHIKELAGGLDSPVAERGENFSMGQRQMACLGRALLRPSRILLLDEATAAVDMNPGASPPCVPVDTAGAAASHRMVAQEEEPTFESADAGASQTHPMQAGHIKRGSHLMIKGHPCKVADLRLAEPGKHGHWKAHFVALDIFTGRKYEDICPTSQNVDVPFVTRTEYLLLNAEEETGSVSLLLKDCSTKDDLNLPCFLQQGKPTAEDAKVQTEILEAFRAGKTTIVAVLSACGMEKIVGVKTADA